MRGARVLACAALVLMPATGASAFSVHGKITNGTTGAVVKNAKITIIQPSAGMKEVGAMETHDGTFSFTGLGNDAPIYLLRTEYAGVMYNGQVPVTGQDQEVNVDVYESTSSWQGVDLFVPHLAVTRHGNELLVEQMYEIDNNTTPPKSIAAKDGGAFRMWLPADMDSIAECYVMTAAMPLRMTPVVTDTKDMYSFDYPVRPGQTRFVISYYIPYPDTYTMHLKFVAPLSHMSVFAVDSTMQVSSSAKTFEQQKSVHGMSVFTIHNVAAKQEVALTFAGGDPNFAGLQVDANGKEGGDTSGGANIPSDGSISVSAGEDEKISRFLMATVLLVLAGVVGMSLRDRHDPLSDPQVLRRHYELLLGRLVRLDDLHAANAIPNDAYRASREELIGRLAALAMQLRSHGGVHAPGRPAPVAGNTKVQ